MVKKCINGHYYDGGRFEQCPYCGAKDMTQKSEPESDMTIPLGFSKPAQPAQQAAPVPAPVPQPAPAFSADDDDDATIPLALYNKRKAAAQEAPAPVQSAVSSVMETPAEKAVNTEPVEESSTEDATLKMDMPKSEFIPEQKPEAEPVVTNDIAALVADAIGDDKSVQPDVTEQPSAEEVAAADAAMQQEQQPVAVETASVPTESFGVTQQPAVNLVIQQEQPAIPAAQPMPMQPTVNEQPAPVQPVQTVQPVYGQPMPTPYGQQYTEQYQQQNQAAYNGGYGYQQQAAQAQQPYNAPAQSPQPVVGWLIGLNGTVRGSIFELRAGRNFIGRAPESEILLADDNTVSYSRHASVIYEPNTRTFIAQAGESNGLIYVNGEMVLNGAQLSAYDRITVGKTNLLFFPLCSEAFAWEDLDAQE